MKLKVLIFFIVALGFSEVYAQQWTYEFVGSEKENFLKAEFLLALNPNINKPNSVLIFIDDSSGYYRRNFTNQELRELSVRTQSVVMLGTFKFRTKLEESGPVRGGEFALKEALREFSKKTGELRDLENLNLFLIGRGVRTEFVYDFALAEDKRVAGVVMQNPSIFTKIPTSAVRKIPMFFLANGKKFNKTSAQVNVFFEEQRRLGALWARIDLVTFRDEYLLDSLVRSYAEQMLNLRVEKDRPLGDLEKLTFMNGWAFRQKGETSSEVNEYDKIIRSEEVFYSWCATEEVARRLAIFMEKKQ